MTTAKIQTTALLEMQERHGVIIRLVMRSRVVELSDTSYLVLMSALAASGIPAAGSSLSGAPNLILTDRNPTLIDKTTVDVDLVYEHFKSDGYSLDSPPTGVVVGECRVNLAQVTSNTDIDGNPLSVSHTYPSDDPDFPGETKTQGGEIEYFQPQRTFTIRGLKSTQRPSLIANAIIATVNDAAWSGEGTHEWMCVGVTWEIFDTETTNQYMFSFEFQHNPDTWNPTIIFKDPRTDRPPEDLVEDVGIKYVRKHREGNFEQILAVRIQEA